VLAARGKSYIAEGCVDRGRGVWTRGHSLRRGVSIGAGGVWVRGRGAEGGARQAAGRGGLRALSVSRPGALLFLLFEGGGSPPAPPPGGC
jgi:hypothetical protein